MTQADRKRKQERAIQRMTEAFNTGQVDIVDELVAPDENIEDSPMPGTSRDRLGLKMKIQHLRTAFPDGKFKIEEMTSDGDSVTFKWRLVGTHKGRFLDRKPTNKKVDFSGTDVVTFRDGLMVEHRSFDNEGRLLAAKNLGAANETIR
jgi:predicted ester cyclase